MFSSVAKQRFALLLAFKKHLFFALLTMLITALAQLALPKIVNYYVDGHAPSALFASFHFYVLGFVVVFALMAAIRFFLFESLGVKLLTHVRSQIHHSLLYKSASYYDDTNAAELTSRINTDTQVLKDVLTTDAALFLRSAIIMIGCTVMMFSISYILALTLVVLIPTFFIATKLLTRKIEQLAEQEQAALATTNKVAFDNINCHNLITLNNWYHSSQKRYVSACQDYINSALKTVSAIASFQGFFNLLVYCCLIAMLIIGSHFIHQGSLTIGEFTSFVLYLVMAFTSLNAVSGFWATWQQSIGATNYIFSLIKTESQTHLPSQPLALPNSDIVFDKVSFSYPSNQDKKVLDQISFQVRQGEKTVIAGPSGTGKSTIAKLLLGYYSPNAGNITIAGQRLDDSNVASLRAHTAYVEQEPLFMSLSIIENLLPETLGTPTESQMADAISACKQANAHEFIMQLPDGYYTAIGDRGGLLSGGQKQRLAIARALLKQPKIVILDEFTSALDQENKASIERALDSLLRDKTVLIISHQLSHIQGADNLIELT